MISARTEVWVEGAEAGLPLGDGLVDAADVAALQRKHEEVHEGRLHPAPPPQARLVSQRRELVLLVGSS